MKPPEMTDEQLRATITPFAPIYGDPLHDICRAIIAARDKQWAEMLGEPVATIGTKAYDTYHNSNGTQWLEPAGSKTVVYFKELPVGTPLYAPKQEKPE